MIKPSLNQLIIRERKWFYVHLIVVVFFAALVVFQWYLFSYLADSIFLKGKSPRQIVGIVSLLVTIVLLRSIFSSAKLRTGYLLSSSVKRKLRREAVKFLLKANPVFLINEERGNLVTALTSAIDRIGNYITDYFSKFLLVAILPPMILMVVFPVDLVSGLVFLITAPVIPFMMYLVGSTTKKKVNRKWRQFLWLANYFFDSIRGVETLKYMGAGSRRLEELRKTGEEYREATMGVLKVAFSSALLLELIATVSTAVVAVEVGLRLLYGKIPFLWGFFIILLAPEFYSPFRELGSSFHTGEEGKEGFETYLSIFEISPLPERGVLPPPEKMDIEFENVWFQYPDTSRPVLRELSLRARRGEKVALVGKSGSGKTTLFYLLLGYLSPVSGHIRIDGVELGSIRLREWWKKIVWIPQNPHVFLDELRGDIPSGVWADPDKVRMVFSMAGLDDLWERRDTPELPEKLSGGERQRVAIARAMMRDSPLVLLDEFTASLDPETQARVEDSMWKLLEGRTAIVIAHRVETVKRADRVIVLHEGRIVGEGKHEELIVSNSFYRELFGERA